MRDSYVDNPIKLTQRLVQLLNIPVTKRSIRAAFVSHPDYPSLLSITDTFDQWDIDSRAVAIGHDQLRHVALPAIFHFKENQEDYFVLAESMNDEHIQIYDTDKGKLTLLKADFLRLWDGISILLDIDRSAGEENYRQHRRAEILHNLRIPLLISGFLAFWLIGLFHIDGVTGLIVYGLLLLGLGSSVLIVLKEFEIAPKWTDNLCKMGNEGDCDSVIASSSSKLFGWLGLSDMSLVFFASITSTCVLGLLTDVSTQSELALLFLFSIPMVVYSLFTQYYVVKSWCLLCNVVVGAIVMLNVVHYPTLAQISLTGTALSFLTIGFVVSGLGWMSIKSLFISDEKILYLESQLNRIKLDPDLWQLKWNRQPTVLNWIPNKGDVIYGDITSKHKLIVVSDPYCGPCSDAHPKLAALIDKSADLCVIVRLRGDPDKSGTRKNLIISTISSMADMSLKRQALDDWYLWKDPDRWRQKYSHESMPIDHTVAEANHSWLSMNQISGTPTYILNGKILSHDYAVDDIRYFLKLVVDG